ncbi:hypothetical protein COCCADRAFT_39688 [Bipolaris zeicola 26-R-13]|uniref:AAA+ ATPase domain-containing protein n=1 Tax=Cochliobolus carbonum (strain 26-R-13) TaxID=930089 RepID=W6XXJ6_COCC2|nr:uncharacterized protein COCCADRAFT_39688 [Bipolaris zeicola 26-R-13]EUC30000.1 hypothetical protein COCCADRAFT_39688 [Bipolaris zeicola 26-R-13]
MRLLHFDQFGRLLLTDFHGKPVPPYAILSHRWEESEILFEDIASETYKEKKVGYRKLLFCAKQAAQDQLQYFWIDTCCIKKWDRLELSRAINSMFRWYRKATKCYVFLSDVSNTTDTVQSTNWEASFRASAWFTRGWTLQELIAPASVEFFSCKEQRLGDKSSLEQLVHGITKIPLAALRNHPLDKFSLHERMHWADNRVTTEQEDIVYCLFGLLGVTMQINYGEGKEKAWRRLQTEVEATNRTPSIIPFSRNEHFVGRESQLAALQANLVSNDHTTTTTRLAIVGPGGTGKSQLALELAYRVREEIKTCSVFWLDASNMESLERSYYSIAQRLNIPGWDDEKADAKQLVKLHLEKEDTAHCLLIFDNLEDITLRAGEILSAGGVGLTAYLPQSTRCSFVFTTTEISLAEQMASQALIELQELTPDSAKEMLKNYLNRDKNFDSTEEQQARILLQELSHLPLAIIQAAAYINVTAVSLEGYQSKLKTQNDYDVKPDSSPSRERPQRLGAKDPVATTLFISLDEIRRSHALAAEYVLLAACVASKDIPFELFENENIRERENAIQVLSKYRLVTRRPEDSALDLHRLVHCALQEWLQQHNQFQEQMENAITKLLRIFPDHNHQNRSKWRRLFPHTKYVLSYKSPGVEDGKQSDLVWKYARALDSDGHYNEVEELLTRLMGTRKRGLGDEHPDTLTCIASLATTYRNQDRWKEAEDLEVQVLEISKRVLGDEHPNTLINISNLASTYYEQGRWKEAEELQTQVLEIRKRILGDEDPYTLTDMSNLATIYSEQGRWKEAEELLLRVIEMEKRVLPDDYPKILITLTNLAMTYTEQERWNEAQEIQLQVFEVGKRILGNEHPLTLVGMSNLAFTLKHQGRAREALSLIQRCCQLYERVLGANHPSTKRELRWLDRWRAESEEEHV